MQYPFSNLFVANNVLKMRLPHSMGIHTVNLSNKVKPGLAFSQSMICHRDVRPLCDLLTGEHQVDLFVRSNRVVMRVKLDSGMSIYANLSGYQTTVICPTSMKKDD